MVPGSIVCPFRESVFSCQSLACGARYALLNRPVLLKSVMAGYKVGDTISVSLSVVTAKLGADWLRTNYGDVSPPPRLLAVIEKRGRGAAWHVKLEGEHTMTVGASNMAPVQHAGVAAPAARPEGFDLESESSGEEEEAEEAVPAAAQFSEWRQGEISACQRMAAGSLKPRSGSLRDYSLCTSRVPEAPMLMFKAFPLLQELETVVRLTNQAGKAKFRWAFTFDDGAHPLQDEQGGGQDRAQVHHGAASSV